MENRCAGRGSLCNGFFNLNIFYIQMSAETYLRSTISAEGIMCEAHDVINAEYSCVIVHLSLTIRW